MTILQWIQNMDAQILLFIQQYIRKDIFDGFWKTITFLGDGGWFWIALGVILLIPKKTRKAGFTALIALAIGAVFTNLGLKQLVARTRPYDAVEGLVPLVAKLKDFSFPSGHTCASFAMCSCISAAVSGNTGKRGCYISFPYCSFKALCGRALSYGCNCRSNNWLDIWTSGTYAGRIHNKKTRKRGEIDIYFT